MYTQHEDIAKSPRIRIYVKDEDINNTARYEQQNN